MKLYEFQGKRIFEENGIRIPKGTLLLSPSDKDKISLPAVLKAQVLTGGRGKAGGVKFCDNKDELDGILNKLFSLEIKGEPVNAVLAIQEDVKILREFYVSIIYKGTSAAPYLVFCSDGGVEIEKVAEENPEKIITMQIDPFVGPTEYMARYIAKMADYEDVNGMRNLLQNLYKAMKSSDATLVEINPLVVTPEGLVALDSKVVLDDKVQYRQKELHEKLLSENKLIVKDMEKPREDTITYVPLSGSVGLISDGAGTGMLTLDLIKDAGGEPACFCELGGITNAQVMYDAMCEVMKGSNVKSLLVVLIGGFNRMDHMAEGIIRYKEEFGINIPVSIRMCGTLEDVGKEMMKNADIPTYDVLPDAVNSAVLAAGGK